MDKTVVVVGAGAAGMAAAIAAASLGADVVLLEKDAQPGGTVAHSMIHTIGGLHDASGEYLNEGLPVVLAERLLQASSLTHKRKMGRTWTLSVSPEVYQQVTEAWLADAGVQVLCGSSVRSVTTNKGRVEHLELATPTGTLSLGPDALVDTTGSAEVIRLIDPQLVRDDARAAGGLVFQMCDVEPETLQFPKSLELVRAIRRAAGDGTLPPDCAKAWVDVGAREDEAYVKLFVPLPKCWREPDVYQEIIQRATQTRDEMVSFLGHLPGFAKSTLGRTGKLGVRDGGRVVGDYCLTESDVKGGRKFPDAACRGSWPVEYWDPDKGVTLEYLNDYYEIPLRALRPRGLVNVWTAGKSLSAEPKAQASARIAGCCWAMGQAVGKTIVSNLSVSNLTVSNPS